MQIYWKNAKKLFLSTVFIALLTVLLAACGSKSVTPTPTVIPASPALILIRMLDQTNGWALTNHAILKTKDGGLHWKTMKTLPAVSLTPDAAFRDTNYAWVTFHESSAEQGVFTMLRTTNGGAKWQTVTIQDPMAVSSYDGIERPLFVTTQEGWVITGQELGMYHSSMTIFHTTDGGLHWTMIANTAPQSHNGLPNSGDNISMTFKDSQTGWVTMEIPGNYAGLSMTTNGGKNWKQQTLLPPKVFSNAKLIRDFITTPPVFFGNNGILPTIILYQTQTYMVLYVTHDGGKTWTPTTPTPIDDISSNISIADGQHAWFSENTTFYATSDGGRSWAKVGQIPSEIGEMSFVDANNGWAVGSLTNKSPLLLHTTNGGKTWQTIKYFIQ